MSKSCLVNVSKYHGPYRGFSRMIPNTYRVISVNHTARELLYRSRPPHTSRMSSLIFAMRMSFHPYYHNRSLLSSGRSSSKASRVLNPVASLPGQSMSPTGRLSGAQHEFFGRYRVIVGVNPHENNGLSVAHRKFGNRDDQTSNKDGLQYRRIE